MKYITILLDLFKGLGVLIDFFIAKKNKSARIKEVAKIEELKKETIAIIEKKEVKSEDIDKLNEGLKF